MLARMGSTGVHIQGWREGRMAQHCENSFQCLRKFSFMETYDLPIPLLDAYPGEMKMFILTNSHLRMFITAVCITPKQDTAQSPPAGT